MSVFISFVYGNRSFNYWRLPSISDVVTWADAKHRDLSPRPGNLLDRVKIWLAAIDRAAAV
jgi:hypothetical protein